MDKRFYFAYGSNLDEIAMKKRCPDSKLIGSHELKNYKFIINKLGWASIIRKMNSSAFGVIWEISKEDENRLDEYEDVESGLYRKDFISLSDRGKNGIALTYIADNNQVYHSYVEDNEDRYRQEIIKIYIDRICFWAKKHEFPLFYIEEVSN